MAASLKLVLLPKSGRPLNLSSYRPICLLDTLEKLLERIILNRLMKYTESEHVLLRIQLGFRKEKSTVDAIRTVGEIDEKESKPKWKEDRYGDVVAIDVQNALNSVR